MVDTGQQLYAMDQCCQSQAIVHNVQYTVRLSYSYTRHCRDHVKLDSAMMHSSDWIIRLEMGGSSELLVLLTG